MHSLLSLPFLASTSEAAPVSPLWIIPFGLLLILIALGPATFHHFWEKHYPKIALSLGAVTLSYYTFGIHAYERIGHTATEYMSFIVLIGSLFIVSGGIHIRVKGEAKPYVNVIFLAIGAVLANIIGTTGASMLLIRPWIRMNRYRITKFHIVFFIFIVSNCGGCLTPIGDPPLFLGYLQGVPFFWTLQHLWPFFLFVNGILLFVFYFIDRKNFARAPKEISDKETAEETWHITGTHNIFFILMILGGVFIPTPFVREAVMIIATLGSYFTTSKQIHHANNFNFLPIKEVAILFIGIFATMMPALDYLQVHGQSLGINKPIAFYFSTGFLSAALDNAPTYLSFLYTSLGVFYEGQAVSPSLIASFANTHTPILISISIGAVFFGAGSYIGNGPNFMVKSIADQSKVHAPNFMEYIFKYSLPILVPILILCGFIFL